MRTATQRHEIEAWLGDDHGLTDDQVTGLMEISDEIYARYCTPDEGVDDPEMVELDLAQASEVERQEALTTAYRLMVEQPGEVVTQLGVALRSTRQQETRVMAALRQAARQLVATGGGQGIESQAGFARAAGVDRMTVRDWLGLR